MNDKKYQAATFCGAPLNKFAAIFLSLSSGPCSSDKDFLSKLTTSFSPICPPG
jgi:hypothetical protein